MNKSPLTYKEKFKRALEEYFKEKVLTEKIITKDSNEIMTWDEANEWCEEQGGRLPKMWELAKAYDDELLKSCDEDSYEEEDDKKEWFSHKAKYYWSSTEFSLTEAYYVYFGNGNTGYDRKTTRANVRCILN